MILTKLFAATPSLSFLYTLNCTLGESLAVGNVPNGNRVVIPITGGVFAGPKISGKVLNLGADWGLIDNNGTFSADTRYHLVTDDGTNIFIRTSGPAQKNGNIHLRLQYETSTVGKYSWLNDVIAVGILKAGNGYVVIDAYELTSLA
ncbi:Uncharacterized protein family UPF0311 [Naviculisporaceae sp. PSN 640]